VSQSGTKTKLENSAEGYAGERDATDAEVMEFRARVAGQLRLLLRKRGYLAKAFLAGLLSGCLVAFLIPARYESLVQLMPPDNQANSGLAMLATLTAKTGGGLGGVAGDLLGMKSSGALFVGILRSRTVEDRISERFQLKKVYAIKLEQDVRNKLSENTAISEDRKSGILTIAVTDGDPRRAARIATAYVDELNQLVAELSTSSAHRERVFLEERLRAVKLDLDEASKQFSQFASKNNTIDIKEQGRAMVQGASTVEGELIASESELKGLEEIYADNNVRVRSLRARITELKRQLEKLGGTGAGDSGRATESSGYPSISRLPLLGVTYADLYRRMQIQEAVYETLTQQYELAKVQEAKETPSVKVLDAASLPERKSYPPRTLIALLVTLVVSGGAVIFVVARSAWEQTDANDPGKVFAQEVLQVVQARMPWTEPNGSRAQAVAHRVWVRLAGRRNPEKPSGSSAN
jgi:capsule polysaccharide export protein KpsE/RkpR